MVQRPVTAAWLMIRPQGGTTPKSSWAFLLVTDDGGQMLPNVNRSFLNRKRPFVVCLSHQMNSSSTFVHPSYLVDGVRLSVLFALNPLQALLDNLFYAT